MGSLRDMSVDYLTDNKEVDKLLLLLNTNKLTDIKFIVINGLEN